MKQIFVTIYLKFKTVTCLFVRGAAAPLNPPCPYSIYMNKIIKTIIQFKKSGQNIQKNQEKTHAEKNRFDRFWIGCKFLCIVQCILNLIFFLNLHKITGNDASTISRHFIMFTDNYKIDCYFRHLKFQIRKIMHFLYPEYKQVEN